MNECLACLLSAERQCHYCDKPICDVCTRSVVEEGEYDYIEEDGSYLDYYFDSCISCAIGR